MVWAGLAVVKVLGAAMPALGCQMKHDSARLSSFVALAGVRAAVLVAKPLCCLCSED